MLIRKRGHRFNVAIPRFLQALLFLLENVTRIFCWFDFNRLMPSCSYNNF